MIVGLGADLTEVQRLRETIERRGERILRRLFTPAEIAYCEQHRNKYERYAGRFAVKEAAMKALGTGWRHGVRWVDIEIIREVTGKPALKLRGVAKEFADRLGVKHMAITITHTEELAVAQVIFEN